MTKSTESVLRWLVGAIVAASFLLAWNVAETRALNIALEVRRQRQTEPLRSTWRSGAIETELTTPRIEDEEVHDWIARHVEALNQATALFPELRFSHGTDGVQVDQRNDDGGVRNPPKRR